MEALGIDLTWFLFQLGNFVVLLALLTWFLHKPLLKLLDDRRHEVAEGVRQAEEARQQLASAEARRAEMLEEARREGAALLKEAKGEAETLSRLLKEEADKRTERLRKAAEEQVAAEAAQLRQDLKKELAGLVATATEKALKETGKKPA